MKIQDVMTPDVRCVGPETPVRDAARIMKEENIGIVPVVEGTWWRLIGVVTDRDIAIRVVAEDKDSNTVVRDVMSGGELATCSPDDDVDSVMKAMATEQVRRIPIVDERGALVGIVAQADIVRKADDRKAEDTVERISEPGGKHSE